MKAFLFLPAANKHIKMLGAQEKTKKLFYERKLHTPYMDRYMMEFQGAKPEMC